MGNEILYTNGHFYTMSKETPVVDSVYVKDGIIVSTGLEENLSQLVSSKCEIIDLKGHTVLPGLCDCHGHLMYVGRSAQLLPLTDKTKEEILQLVEEKCKETPQGEWIQGIGWNQDLWEDSSFPTKEELDVVSPNHPVKLIRHCGNSYWCNSMALNIAGLTKPSEDTGIQGKELLLNEKGELQGTLVGESCKRLDAAIPKHEGDKYEYFFALSQDELLKNGYTSVMDKGAGIESPMDEEGARACISAIHRMYQSQKMKIRIYEAPAGTDEYFDECFKDGPIVGMYDGKLTIRGIKLWDDGAFGPRTASLSTDYRNMPGHRGNQKLKDDLLIELLKKVDSLGLQAAVHSIGNASTKHILKCYEAAFSDSEDKDRRFIMEHFPIPDEEDMRMVLDNNIIVSVQFSQFSSDMDSLGSILPDELLTNIYPWREILDRGGIICNGSDAPIDPVNPFPAMYIAVSRKSLSGKNLYEKDFSRALTRTEALEAYTTSAAYAKFEEKVSGSIEPGKYADFTVIDRDYFECPVEEIRDITVLETIIAGESAYKKRV